MMSMTQSSTEEDKEEERMEFYRHNQVYDPSLGLYLHLEKEEQENGWHTNWMFRRHRHETDVDNRWRHKSTPVENDVYANATDDVKARIANRALDQNSGQINFYEESLYEEVFSDCEVDIMDDNRINESCQHENEYTIFELLSITKKNNLSVDLDMEDIQDLQSTGRILRRSATAGHNRRRSHILWLGEDIGESSTDSFNSETIK